MKTFEAPAGAFPFAFPLPPVEVSVATIESERGYADVWVRKGKQKSKKKNKAKMG